MRIKVGGARYYRVTDAMRKKIEEAYQDLGNSGAHLEGYKGFEMGFVCGMKTPTFEAVKEAVAVMQTFSKLTDRDKELVLLIQEGLIARSIKDQK